MSSSSSSNGWTLARVQAIQGEDLVMFLVERGVLLRPSECLKCGEKEPGLQRNGDSWRWRCNDCKKKTHALRDGSVFEGSLRWDTLAPILYAIKMVSMSDGYLTVPPATPTLLTAYGHVKTHLRYHHFSTQGAELAVYELAWRKNNISVTEADPFEAFVGLCAC